MAAQAEGVQVERDFLALRLPAQPARWERRLSLELAQEPAGAMTPATRVQPTGGAPASLPPLQLQPGASTAQQCSELPAAPLATSRPAPVQKAEDHGNRRPALRPATGRTAALRRQVAGRRAPGVEWLHPRTGFTPALPVIKVAIKHAKGSQVELKVNGAASTRCATKAPC